jgi:hypothetical protein
MGSEEFVTIENQKDQKTLLNHTSINTNSIVMVLFKKKAVQ